MRRIVLTFALAVLSLAFAPAPFPKAERGTERQRAMRECERQLRELGVKWELRERVGKPSIRFEVRYSTRRGTPDFSGNYPVRDGDLPGSLRALIRFVQGRLNRLK